jgi:hypothetical protein
MLNRYYHTIDRVYTSFPEIVYGGGQPDVIKKAVDRLLSSTTSATDALKS